MWDHTIGNSGEASTISGPRLVISTHPSGLPSASVQLLGIQSPGTMLVRKNCLQSQNRA